MEKCSSSISSGREGQDGGSGVDHCGPAAFSLNRTEALCSFPQLVERSPRADCRPIVKWLRFGIAYRACERRPPAQRRPEGKGQKLAAARIANGERDAGVLKMPRRRADGRTEDGGRDGQPPPWAQNASGSEKEAAAATKVAFIQPQPPQYRCNGRWTPPPPLQCIARFFPLGLWKEGGMERMAITARLRAPPPLSLPPAPPD